jgi:hypothetical protein
LERVEGMEGAWGRARAALVLHRLDGRRNDRASAGSEIAAAVAGLPGPEWKTVRNFLLDRRSLAFLDRMHRRLETAEPRPEWRAAMAWRWWLRHRRPAVTANPLTTLAHAAARRRPLTGEEKAWCRARAALELFRLDGRLNDRVSAGAEIAAAVAGLAGPEWKTVRNFLLDRRSLTFLDRMHQRLETAEPRPEWRGAMAWRWWLRHRRPAATANPSTALVHAVARQRPLSGPEQASYDRVAAVLNSTVRASSAVECMNSVLRMQQSRHKRMTQPMLDLKRLYWNSHPFRSGPRKDACPYRSLGLGLPTFDFWELLQADPAELTQELSTQGNAM